MKDTLRTSEVLEFPGDPGVRTQQFYFWAPGSVPDLGARFPQATWCGQKKKRKETRVAVVSLEGRDTLGA